MILSKNDSQQKWHLAKTTLCIQFHNADYHYAQFHNADYHNAECCYTEYYFAECHGAQPWPKYKNEQNRNWKKKKKMTTCGLGPML